ncbi:oligopeptide transport system substrate-binding protein [Hathewaya proteolytica DSM 3090]|uniref:Oligopeptide transport system substrate-binding protein n=1 Tax=Hathewaya proteolytica DSM 3090 TaxID=1121331 RepID=A0A1M6QRM1_9CLOT|nr:peptide ABC transporter substrate-binding protein [Hathewaya proteolytica]SHK22750.1 oligopeptide transport system substrate-binding protein [Hathewaya proteolytica DSM 3090]
MKSKKLLSTVLALTMVSSTLLVGCGDKKTEEKKPEVDTTAKDNAKKDKVQELTFASAPGAQVNPGVTRTNTEWGPEGYIYEGLVRNAKNKDGVDAPKEGVAKSWEKSSDGLTYTFTLRDNAKWADGQAVTAEDFVYSWQRLVDPKSDCAKNGSLLNGIVKNAKEIQEGTKAKEELGVKADGNKFIVTLEKPCLYFLEYCFHPNLKPVRKDYVEKYGKEMGKTVESIMGNGAYKCTFYQVKNKMVFEKSDTYWNKDTRDIQKITFLDMREENPKYSAFTEKQIDRVGLSDSDLVSNLKSMEHVQNISKQGTDVTFFMFNCKNEFLANKNIRKAIANGFSREGYIDTIANGLGQPAYNMVPPTISCGGNKYNPGDFKSEISKLDAKALLKEGLKELGKSEDPSQIQLRIVTRGTTQNEKDTVEYFIDEFKKNLGIVIKADLVDYTIMYDKVGKGDYEIAYGGWFADWNDPSNFLDTFITGGYYAAEAGYSNKDYDALIEKAHNETDAKKAAEFYAQAEKIICIDDPAIASFEFGASNTFSWDFVKGYENRPNLGFEDFEGIYISGKEDMK